MTGTPLSILFTTAPLLWAHSLTADPASCPRLSATSSSLVSRQDNNGIIVVTTDITADREPVSVEINVADSVAHFQAALEEDGEIFDGDFEVAATRLVRWDSCDDYDKKEIYKGWRQSWKLMNGILDEVEGLNWNEASAVEYLGPPGLIQPVQGKMKGEPEWTYDVGTYLMNGAHVWAHELMRIDWATNAGSYGDNRHVSDLRIRARNRDGRDMEFKVYGSQVAKALARYPVDTGDWTMRNADSLALYATVRYIQSQLDKVYPHLPLAPAAPDTVYDPSSREEELRAKEANLPFLAFDLRGVDLYGDNGTVALPPLHNFYDLNNQPDCPAWYPADATTGPPADDVWDEDADGNDDYVVTLDQFASAADLGEEYTNQLNEWWNELYAKADECFVPSGCENVDPDGCAVLCF